jgi:hypothetical protein
MQITTDSVDGQKVIFESILDEFVGGAGLNVTRLDNETHNSNVDKRYLKAGAPVYVVPSTRVAELCKSAIAIDGGTSTAIRVAKNHHFKVGDFMGDGTTTGLISAITTTEDDYDTITVNTALTYAEGTKFVEGTVTGSSAVLKYTPNGVVKSDIYMGDGNADVAIVRAGVAREDALTYCMPDLYKKALRGGTAATGTSLITFE